LTYRRKKRIVVIPECGFFSAVSFISFYPLKRLLITRSFLAARFVIYSLPPPLFFSLGRMYLGRRTEKAF